MYIYIYIYTYRRVRTYRLLKNPKGAQNIPPVGRPEHTAPVMGSGHLGAERDGGE